MKLFFKVFLFLCVLAGTGFVVETMIHPSQILQGGANNGDVLAWDGSNYAPSVISGDNMGNHIATNGIELNFNSISNNGIGGLTISDNGVVNTSSEANIGGLLIRRPASQSTVLGASTSNTGGQFCSMFGFNSGGVNTGSSNSFFGTTSGRVNSTGNTNSFFGVSSGFNNTTGSQNVFFGVNAGFSNTTGNNNTMIGRSAGFNMSAGNENTLIGTFAGSQITETVIRNLGLGYSALNANSGNENIGLGYQAGQNNSGDLNILVGNNAGRDIIGNNNLVIGNNSNPPLNSASNQISLMNTIYGIDCTGSLDNSSTDAKIGINTKNPNANLHVVGSILQEGTSNVVIDDGLIGISGVSDADFLEYQGTKISIGELNTQSKSANATAVLNVGGFSDNKEIVRVRSNDNTGYFQIIQKTISEIEANIVQAGVEMLKIKQDGNVFFGNEIQAGFDYASNSNSRIAVTQGTKDKALEIFMSGDKAKAVDMQSEGRNYVSLNTTTSNRNVELGHFDATNPVPVLLNYDTEIRGQIIEKTNLATNYSGNLLSTSGSLVVEKENAWLIAEDSNTNTHFHIELEATTEANNQSNIIIMHGYINGTPFEAKRTLTFSNAAVNSVAYGTNTTPATLSVDEYESSTGKPVMRVTVAGGTLEDTIIPITVRIGREFNGISEIVPDISRVVINTGANI